MKVRNIPQLARNKKNKTSQNLVHFSAPCMRSVNNFVASLLMYVFMRTLACKFTMSACIMLF